MTVVVHPGYTPEIREATRAVIAAVEPRAVGAAMGAAVEEETSLT
jgi:hypothetical protein